MPLLLVLNGPPAVGKSTVAGLFVDEHPLALRLDIDELRESLGGWRASAADAGLRARALATVMATDHLRAGHDVVVAQCYGRPDHLDELEGVAAGTGSAYAEVVLMTDVATTLDRFTRRGGPRLDEVLDAPDGLAAVALLHERVAALASERDQATVVASIPGDPAATYAAVLEAIGDR